MEQFLWAVKTGTSDKSTLFLRIEFGRNENCLKDR